MDIKFGFRSKHRNLLNQEKQNQEEILNSPLLFKKQKVSEKPTQIKQVPKIEKKQKITNYNKYFKNTMNSLASGNISGGGCGCGGKKY
jgi:hypothetical protein